MSSIAGGAYVEDRVGIAIVQGRSFRDEDFGLAVGLDSGEAGGGSVA